MDFWQVVESRHSLRDFSDKSVSRESVEQLLHAARLAPSAMNLQPWRFHVATGETRLRVGQLIAQGTTHLTEWVDILGPERYEAAVKWYSDLGGAPVLICVSMPSGLEGPEESNTLMGIGAAVENLLLAAAAEGLGACNITVPEWVQGAIDELIGLPEDRTLIAIVAVGYPGKPPEVLPEKHTDIADWLG